VVGVSSPFARRLAFQGFRDGRDVLGGVAAAAAGDAEPPFAAVVPVSQCLKIGVQTNSVSEIEFCTLYVVTERWILAACCGSCA
jgi:hypothetical protein